MADHVVQLARDARPFLGDGGSRPLLALALETLCAFFCLPVLRELRAERVPGEPDDREEDADEENVAGALGRVVVGDDRRGSDPDSQSGHRLSPFGEHSEQERAREDRQEDAERKGHEASFEERDTGAVDEDCRRRSEREPPSREQRQEDQKRERDEHPQRSGRGFFVVGTPVRELERGFNRPQ